MLIFKWIGCLLLLGAGTLVGIALLTLEKRRVTQGEGFLALVRFLRWQIDTLARPLPDILAACESSVLAACGWQSDLPPADFHSLLDGAELCLSEEICTLLYEFANGLGATYREEQLRACEYLLTRITPYCDTLRRELPKRERIAVFLPIAATVALILLLI